MQFVATFTNESIVHDCVLTSGLYSATINVKIFADNSSGVTSNVTVQPFGSLFLSSEVNPGYVTINVPASSTKEISIMSGPMLLFVKSPLFQYQVVAGDDTDVVVEVTVSAEKIG